MIDLHYWPTPNGWKVAIMLEELALPYRIVPVDIGRGQQFAPGYAVINPNRRIPAIVDHAPADGGEPIVLAESGAILWYLAEKTGRLLPADPRARLRTLQWLMWQMGGFGPMLGQTHHFRNFADEPVPYAIARYTSEANRLYGVLDSRLRHHLHVAGPDYTLADVACLPWASLHAAQGQTLDEFPNVGRWLADCAARPAVARGRMVGRELWPHDGPDAAAKRILFGQRAVGG